MSIAQVVQTPWADWAEWTFVRDRLLPPGELVFEAIEVVQMWRSRGRVPHAVDSTAQLVEVMVRDREGGRSENELRLAYSMVVVRAVNGLVDPSQQGYYAEAVSVLAARMGLPQWLVELRHDATHGQLPTLPVLRSAADCILLWLNDNYWAPQFSFLEELSRLCVPASAAAQLTAKELRIHRDLIFGAKSTVLPNLFLPMFLKAVIVTEAVDLAHLHNLCEQAWELWSSTLEQGMVHDFQVGHALICGIVCHALRLIENNNLKHLDCTEYCCSYWVQRILEILDSSSDSQAIANLRSDRNFTEICVIIECASSTDRYQDLFKAVSMAYGIRSIDTKALRMQPFEFSLSLLKSICTKAITLEKAGGWGKSAVLQSWPLGVVPGSITSEELCCIEYDDSP